MKFKQIRVNYGDHSKLVMVRDDKPTFTKGPWHCGQGNGEGSIFADNGGRVTFSNKGTALHPICHIQNSFEENEDRANARLIAAAPELLEQCKFLEKVLTEAIMSGDSGADLELDQLRELLAKVEGEK